MERPNGTRALFLGLSALALAAMGATPAAADDAPACTPASTAAAVSADGSPGEAVETSDGVGAASTCTADCWDGTTLTCGEGSSCSARDDNCSIAVQGYCEDSSGRKYCPPCPGPTCTASTLCGDGPGSGIDCDGDRYCNEAHGCWVHCDGQTTWCPDADPFSCPEVN